MTKTTPFAPAPRTVHNCGGRSVPGYLREVPGRAQPGKFRPRLSSIGLMPCEHQLLRTPPLRHDLPAGRVGSAGTNVHGGQVKEPTLPGGTACCEEQASFGGALRPVHRLLVRVIHRVSGEYIRVRRGQYIYT